MGRSSDEFFVDKAAVGLRVFVARKAGAEKEAIAITSGLSTNSPSKEAP